MTGRRPVFRKLMASRWRHVVILLPLGAAVGTLFGLIFSDLAYGVMIGLAFGAGFGLLFALRNPA